MAAFSLLNVTPVGFGPPAAPRDLHVDTAGRIASSPAAGARTVDCRGAYVSPGWADLHVHIWYGGSDFSIRADDAGMKRGVTAMADAGSAGEANFHGLREYVIERQRETIKAFLNIGSIGLVAANRVPELMDTRFVDIPRTLQVIEANRDVICGIKVRASGVVVGNWGLTPLRMAAHVAEMTGFPLMVHIGEAPPLVEEVLGILRPGDVVTHCFNGKPGGSLLDTPARLDLARSCADRGIRFDVGHGAASYSFRAAERAISAGLRPFSISTDLHERNLAGPVHDLATTVSKLHAAGLDFEQCIAAIADAPRSFLGLGVEGGLEPGARADLTVFELVDCAETVTDSLGDTLVLKRMFEPRWSVVGTNLVAAVRTMASPNSSCGDVDEN